MVGDPCSRPPIIFRSHDLHLGELEELWVR
jgi:hypothetical protein